MNIETGNSACAVFQPCSVMSVDTRVGQQDFTSCNFVNGKWQNMKGQRRQEYKTDANERSWNLS